MYSLLFALLLAARPFTPEELHATRRVDDVQVSPDGKWASVTVRQKNLETNKDDKDIWLVPVAGGSPSPATSTRSAPATMPATRSARRKRRRAGSVHASSITSSRVTGASGRKASAPTCS